MIFSVVYLAVRRLLGCLMVLARREVSKDAELLVVLHENAVLRRQIGRVRYQPGDRLSLAALSRLIPGAGRRSIRRDPGDAARLAPAAGRTKMGAIPAGGVPGDRPPQPRSASW